MKLKKISATEFDRVAQLTDMEYATRDMARKVLVYGRTQTDVAAETGMTKQRIFKAVSIIEQAYFDSEGDGTALVSLNLLLPEKVALELATVSQILEARQPTERDLKIIDELLQALEKAREALEK